MIEGAFLQSGQLFLETFLIAAGLTQILHLLFELGELRPAHFLRAIEKPLPKRCRLGDEVVDLFALPIGGLELVPLAELLNLVSELTAEQLGPSARLSQTLGDVVELRWRVLNAVRDQLEGLNEILDLRQPIGSGAFRVQPFVKLRKKPDELGGADVGAERRRDARRFAQLLEGLFVQPHIRFDRTDRRVIAEDIATPLAGRAEPAQLSQPVAALVEKPRSQLRLAGRGARGELADL